MEKKKKTEREREKKQIKNGPQEFILCRKKS
jgi:hypothetical protein